MNLSALEEIGLTGGEVKVYIALLKLGSAKTGILALNAGVSSSKVYKILARLEQKGLVGHFIKEGAKHYRALELERLIDYINEKESELKRRKNAIQRLLPVLKKQRNIFSEPAVTFYSGFRAVKNLFNGLLDELGPGEEYSVIGALYAGNVEMQKRFFYKFHQRRAHKGIRLKMLASHDLRKDMVKTTFLNSKVRFLPSDFLTQMSILFYKNKAFVFVWSEEIFGILIESKQVVESFETYFKNFWKIAKK